MPARIEVPIPHFQFGLATIVAPVFFNSEPMASTSSISCSLASPLGELGELRREVRLLLPRYQDRLATCFARRIDHATHQSFAAELNQLFGLPEARRFACRQNYRGNL